MDKSLSVCINCKIVLERIKNYGYSDLIIEFQKLQKKICNLDGFDVKKKVASMEIISSLMRQLAHTGKIENIVLKLFDNEMKKYFNNNINILNLWVKIKERLNKEIT
jgi:hypothetical protein